MKKHLLTTLAIAAFSMAAHAETTQEWHGHSDHDRMQQAAAKLPAADAKKLNDRLQQAHEQNKELVSQMHLVEKQLHDILVAKEFDKSDYLAKSQELSELHDKLHEKTTEAFAQAVATLPQNERATLAEGLRPHLYHKPLHHAGVTRSTTVAKPVGGTPASKE